MKTKAAFCDELCISLHLNGISYEHDGCEIELILTGGSLSLHLS